MAVRPGVPLRPQEPLQAQPPGRRRRGQRFRPPALARSARGPRPHDPLPGRDIGDLRRDRDRPAAGHETVDRLYPLETVALPRPPADAAPAAGEADRHRIRLPVAARVEPAGGGHRVPEDLLPGALGASPPALIRGRLLGLGPLRPGWQPLLTG